MTTPTDDPVPRAQRPAAQALDRSLLERCMVAMAAGDAAFLFTFVEHFGANLAGVVRGILADMGRHDVRVDPAEVDALVQDAAFIVFGVAHAWRPDGALPWVWAQRAIRSEVARRVGHRTVGPDDLDVEVSTVGLPDEVDLDADPAGPAQGLPSLGDGSPDLDALALHDPAVRLLVEAAHTVGSERDARLFLEYRIQARIGDRSPAQTVAALFGVTPANARQIHRRMGLRVQHLLAADARFAPLSDLPFLAA